MSLTNHKKPSHRPPLLRALPLSLPPSLPPPSLPQTQMSAWSNPKEINAALTLPLPNEFLPTDFSLKCEQPAYKVRPPSFPPLFSPFFAHSPFPLSSPPFLPPSLAHLKDLAADDPVHPSPPSLLSSPSSPPSSSASALPEKGVKIFHKLDSTFKVPKVYFFAHLLSRQVRREGGREGGRERGKNIPLG